MRDTRLKKLRRSRPCPIGPRHRRTRHRHRLPSERHTHWHTVSVPCTWHRVSTTHTAMVRPYTSSGCSRTMVAEMAQHQRASSYDLPGRSRWPDGIGLSLLMTTAAHAGSSTPGSCGMGPVHSAPRGRVLNARAPLSHLDRVDCPAIPSLLAHADH